MSTPKPNIPNTKKAAKAYIEYLLTLSFVDDVYIGGSRSSKTKKKPTKSSDWDIQVICKNKPKRIFYTDPRKLGLLHADVHWRIKPSVEAVHWKEIIK